MDAFAEEFISYLNLIYRLSVSENAGKTQKMVECIVNHIRYKCMREEEIVKLKTELLQVDNLVDIFRVRFGENLAYRKTVSEDLPDPYIPSNTILALVESALVYGLIPKEGDWKLNIDMRENEQGLLIQVADNGIGLAPSMQESFGSVSERRNYIAAVGSKLREYFSNPNSGSMGPEMGPVTVACSDRYNKVTILVPHSEF